MCPEDFYCPTPTEKVNCPDGAKCPEGSTAPIFCQNLFEYSDSKEVFYYYEAKMDRVIYNLHAHTGLCA